MRTLPTLALAALPWLAVLSGPPDAVHPRLTWYDEAGRTLWSKPLEIDTSGRTTAPLGIGPLQSALPPLEFEFLDGEPKKTADYRGRVLLIDFWASWCGPCAESLPWLKSFHEERQERGLELLTVNMQEPDNVARQFLWALNLELPTARYTPAMHAALDVATLPTLLVVDRSGMIRSRINAYGPGVYDRVAQLTEKLLKEETPERAPIARVIEGQGRLQAIWSGPLPAPIEGLAVVEGADGPIVLATANQEIFGFTADGDAQLRKRTGAGAERLCAIGNPPEGALVFGYRPVGTHIVRLPLGEGRPERIDTETHILDIAFDPGDGEGAARLLLATIDGLALMDTAGRIYERLPRPSIWELSTDGGVLLLEEGGRLVRLDAAWKETRAIDVGKSARRLIPAPLSGSVGVAPSAVLAAVAGRFLETGREQVAVATAEGLLLLDAGDGRLLWSAAWSGIAELAAADLDGDGLAEILVGARRRVVALRAAASPGTSPEK